MIVQANLLTGAKHPKLNIINQNNTKTTTQGIY